MGGDCGSGKRGGTGRGQRMNLGQSKNELRCAPRDDSIVVDLMKIAPLTAHDEAQALVERSLGALFELSSQGAADRVLNDQRTHSRAC